MGAGQEGRGRGNTGTSQELNRTANSSTRVGGGTDRFTLRYAHVHTHTHTKKTGHKLHFLPKLRPSATSVHASRGRGSCGRLASVPAYIAHFVATGLRGRGTESRNVGKATFRILAVVGRNARSRLPQEVAGPTGSSQRRKTIRRAARTLRRTC